MRDLIDTDGENLAVRAFLANYNNDKSMKCRAMTAALARLGFDDDKFTPIWARDNGMHLTKGGAQHWIRHLFELECQSDTLTTILAQIKTPMWRIPVDATAINEEMLAALRWYEEQARLVRLVHSEGDAARQALDADGGERARQVITKVTE